MLRRMSALGPAIRRSRVKVSGTVLVVALAFAACTPSSNIPERDPLPDGTFPGTIAPASCGQGSLPETGLQGQVPLADRVSGRSQQGYRCNLELVGQYQGTGQATVGASYGTCQYLGSWGPGAAEDLVVASGGGRWVNSGDEPGTS